MNRMELRFVKLHALVSISNKESVVHTDGLRDNFYVWLYNILIDLRFREMKLYILDGMLLRISQEKEEEMYDLNTQFRI